ncbi:MAG: ATP-binding protein [Methanomassiliicoccaceae archaeon]|jgi:AAA+ ATPase superfamily predicted ATPase|nr:ATP-binding protein [Methanomassiliicoccaceae archaeon]
MERFFDKGRTFELNSLEGLYHRDEFSFVIMYGRRRIGKTSIINEFINRGNKKAVRFTATEDANNVNLENFSQSVFSVFPELSSLVSFRSWEAAWNFIVNQARGEKLIIYIDEYPYLAKAYPPISSQLQRFIDTVLEKTNMMLILCGSSMSFMENQVLGNESPLYGRRTSQFKVMPLDYFDSAEFFGKASMEDKLLGYAVTNGIPKYLNVIAEERTVRKGIDKAFFTKGGYLYEEPYNLLKQELREPAMYNTIIAAIANGATKLNVIAAKVGEKDSKVATYIKSLLGLGILAREVPILSGSEKNAKYSVKDSMYRFWYRFVPKAVTQIDGGVEDIYVTKVEPFISDFMGPVFEDVCKQYLLRLVRAKKAPFPLDNIGKWWGGNPVTRTETEIDIIATSTTERDIIVGECKWRNKEADTDVLKELRGKAAMFADRDIHHYIFSRSGFTAGLRKAAEKDDRLTLVGLKDLFEV